MMRAKLALLVALAALAYAVPEVVQAAGVSPVVTMTLPDQNTDGTALPLTDIASVIIQWMRPDGTEVIGQFASGTPQALAYSKTLTVLCGKYVFLAAVKDVRGKVSDSAKSAVYDTGVVCQKIPLSVTSLSVK